MIPGADYHVQRHEQAYADVFRAQRSAVTTALEFNIQPLFDEARWNAELMAVVLGQARRTVMAFGGEISARYGTGFQLEVTNAFLADYARITAEATNATTAQALTDALASPTKSVRKDVSTDPEPVEEPELSPWEAVAAVFTLAVVTRAGQMAESKVTTEANFGRTEAAIQAERREKRWVVTSGKRRHASLNGQRVGIVARFSNGAKWPGDPSLPIDQRANCSCIVDFDE